MLIRVVLLLALLSVGGCKAPIKMTKPGVTPAQAERDQQRCAARADEAARAQQRSPKEGAQVKQRVMLVCLRGMGYEVKDAD